MDKQDLWKIVLSELEVNLSRGNFSTWVKPTKLTSVRVIDGKRQIAEIACPSPFHQTLIEGRYYAQIKEVLDRITKKQNELALKVVQQAAERQPPDESATLFGQIEKEETEGALAFDQKLAQAGLRKDFTFETFAVSSTNELAHAAASAVAHSPGAVYNPLFFYGGVGVGKTHLMQAVGNKVLNGDREVSIIYCTGEDFTNDIIAAIQQKKTHEFREKYRLAKVLLIDDIQFIGGKTTVQEEFFHTFNAIKRDGGQIVMASDRAPFEIVGLEDRLRSRFEGGLTIDIGQPNFELRTAILLIKAKQMKLGLSMDVAQLIAANIESARKLEGFLARMVAEAKIRLVEEMTVEMVRSLLGKTEQAAQVPAQTVRPKEVIAATAKYFNLPVSQVIGPRRKKQLVNCRHLAMYILRQDLKLTLMEIGELFGRRDHTTVMHAVEKTETGLVTSDPLRLDLEALKKKIYGI